MLFVCGKTLDRVEINLILKFPSWGFTVLIMTSSGPEMGKLLGKDITLRINLNSHLISSISKAALLGPEGKGKKNILGRDYKAKDAGFSPTGREILFKVRFVFKLFRQPKPAGSFRSCQLTGFDLMLFASVC